MRQVSMRQFQLDANRELQKGLPIRLTKHGKTVAYVSDMNPQPLAEQEASKMSTLTTSIQSLQGMISSLKVQTYSHEPTKLVRCEIHHVYKQTCGCI